MPKLKVYETTVTLDGKHLGTYLIAGKKRKHVHSHAETVPANAGKQVKTCITRKKGLSYKAEKGVKAVYIEEIV